jgi:hypothetical protein
MVRVGDVIEIPLSTGYKAFAHFVHRGKMGLMIRVYDFFTKEDIDIQVLRDVPQLFPPVITGLTAALRIGLWKKIGKIPVCEFVHPKFVSTLFGLKEGKTVATTWYLYDGEKDYRIGPVLPDEFKQLEFLVVWSPYDVVSRIETGEIPFPYRELIECNEYTPRAKSGN